MKFNKKIEIDLLDFIRAGKFGCLKPGMTKKEILQSFSPPEDWMHYENNDIPNNNEDCFKSKIWRYGNFELHFYDNDELWIVFNDYLGEINGGKYLKITPWIFCKRKVPSIIDLIKLNYG